MADPDPSAELERRAEEATVDYERSMALRTLMLAIPGVGSSLDHVLSAGGQRSRERIDEFGV